MNIFTDILFLFVYILTMLYLELPDIKNNDYPIHKFYLFINIFVYYFVIQIIKKIKNKCTIDIMLILQDCLIISLFCVLGYSIYVDFKYWNYTKDYVTDIDSSSLTSTVKSYSLVALIIVSFVTIVQLVKLLFTGNVSECDGHESKNMKTIVKF